MSQSYAAAASTGLYLQTPGPDVPTAKVTRDQIQSYEEGRKPRGVQFLEGRLDIIYGAHGALTRDEVAPIASADGRTSRVAFPYFWTGPIWIQMICNATPAVSACEIGLVWRPWQRKVRIRSGQILTTRRTFASENPLVVQHPAGWQVIAGIGRPDGAVNVEDDWTIIDTRGYFEALHETFRAISLHRARQRVADPSRRRSLNHLD